MPIIDIQRRLHQSGRIRIGDTVEGETKDGKKYSRPKKLDTFRITSSNESAIREVAKLYGGEVKPWDDGPVGGQWEVVTESSAIKVLVPPEAMSFSQFYELWSGGGCQRRCDGETETISDGPCICNPDARICKPYTRLSVMLEGILGAGLWRLDTQGWNAGTEIGGAFELAQLIAKATNRSILPGVLRLEQREAKRPDPKDATKTITQKFVVPVLDFDVDMSELARGVSGVTPIAALPERSLGDELRDVEHIERKTRSNSAEPVRPTGIKVQPRGAIQESESEDEERPGFDYVEQADPQRIQKLRELIELLGDEDARAFAERWKARGVPPITLLDHDQCEAMIALAKAFLNALDGQVPLEPSAPQGESEANPGNPEDVPTVNPDEITSQATASQIKGINIRAGKLGLTDRQERLDRISEIVGEAVFSTKGLTKAQASKVIDVFESEIEALV